MRLLGIGMILALLMTASCGGSDRRGTPNSTSGHISRVKVTQTGVIYLNGKTTSIEDLKKEFALLKSQNGSVWYFRENPQGEPTEQAMAVIKAVVDNKLPIKMCPSEQELNAAEK